MSAVDRAAPTEDTIARLDAWWRAANYLSVGQIYLLDNPLLTEPLRAEHVKPRLLGHWGTTPGLNFVYAHLNRVITDRDVDLIYICGPGHGGPGMVANTWLEGTYSEVYPAVTRDGSGMGKLFRQFSFPGGIPSHAAPETPGSIHEGGELGYALSHAYGAAFDNPDLVVACVIGDGEAETGPLAASWHANKFLDPVHDGAVLPILHLNGWKIANPTVLARIEPDELVRLLEGYGHHPYLVEGDDPATVHRVMATALDEIFDEIARIQHAARVDGTRGRPRWPVLVLRTPKGWTGPAEVDGRPMEGTWRAHQVPLAGMRTNAGHVAALEAWMRSYRPDELFDPGGRPRPEVVALAPTGPRRMGASPHTNGGLLLRDLELPDFRDYGVEVKQPGSTVAEPTRVLGEFLRDVVRANETQRNFRLFGPDETESNRLGAVYEATDKQWNAATLPVDEHLAPDGRVMEILSEHTCQGWLEGYLLTGRHGLFSCYEAFTHLVDSMFNQHAKWLKVTRRLEWRRSIASLNYLLPIDEAVLHCARGAGIWEWASTDEPGQPDVVLACAGDVPTIETLAAADLLRRHLPDVAVRVVNVVDLMRLQPDSEHPHGMPDREYDTVFPPDVPVVFAYHGYPWLIHRLAYRRANHSHLHVRGYKEEGTTTTPFDMVMLNDLDRYHLVVDVIDRVPGLGARAARVRQAMADKRIEARAWTRAYGEDIPEVADWLWPG